MTQQQQQMIGHIFEFEAHITHFKTQLNTCFSLQRSFANSVNLFILKNKYIYLFFSMVQ
jgi:hypothetical protein